MINWRCTCGALLLWNPPNPPKKKVGKRELLDGGTGLQLKSRASARPWAPRAPETWPGLRCPGPPNAWPTQLDSSRSRRRRLENGDLETPSDPLKMMSLPNNHGVMTSWGHDPIFKGSRRLQRSAGRPPNLAWPRGPRKTWLAKKQLVHPGAPRKRVELE